MQSTEILELSKQIKEKLKEVDAFGNTSFADLAWIFDTYVSPIRMSTCWNAIYLLEILFYYKCSFFLIILERHAI